MSTHDPRHRTSEAPSASPPNGVDRRAFLAATGFSALLASGCSETPIVEAIPLDHRPMGYNEGRSKWYATVCGGCDAGCGALVASRDGRPIKLEGLPDHPLSRGGLCAVGQASLLGLYDDQRFDGPAGREGPISWDDLDKAVIDGLKAAKDGKGKVRLLTGTVTSLPLKAALDGFLAAFPDAQRVAYDALSRAAILDAHEATHGARALPHYLFDKAEVIVAFDADFLGTWISPVEFAAARQQLRQIDDPARPFSFHAQFEPTLSLTGGRADRRFRVPPDDLGPILASLADRVERRLGQGGAGGEPPAQVGAVSGADLNALADRLVAAKGKSLVLCGSQTLEAQLTCNRLNQSLENYGATLDLKRRSLHCEGDDRATDELLKELEAGQVAALIIVGVNPVYDLPEGARLADALGKVPLVVYCGERPNETSKHASRVAPSLNELESWDVLEPVDGLLAIRQPLIRPLRDARSVRASLDRWSGRPKVDDMDAAKTALRERAAADASDKDFQTVWDQTISKGWRSVEPSAKPLGDYKAPEKIAPAVAQAGEWSLVLYPKVSLLDGRNAHNPWLQELPDPISKLCWDNYACLSVTSAKKLGVVEGNVVRIEFDGGAGPLELPVHVQQGQSDGVVAVALGYGQETSARFAKVGPQWFQAKPSVGPNGLVGQNVAPLARRVDGRRVLHRSISKIAYAGRSALLATTQPYGKSTLPEALDVLDGKPRPLILETTVDEYRKAPETVIPEPHPILPIYPEDHPNDETRWAMVIDLNACTGCSACVVACQVENNIPVVGKDEISRQRDMFWLRIDRYHSGDGDDADVGHQPMLCQHCGNAPCENVCPVLATVHTEDGLNAQVYNRCVGTRYCANNCPFKVRRFNWFYYPRDNPSANLALNPDVTVRSRGIMEKCTFCVQRIQEGRLEAWRHGAPPVDGAIQTACQQSCPTRAITFGNLLAPESEVAKLSESPRRYRALEEIGVDPSVFYLALARNRTPEPGDHDHA